MYSLQILTWISISAFSNVECTPRPLISSSGMISTEPPYHARNSAAHSPPANLNPELEESLGVDENKRMDRSSSFVIPISSVNSSSTTVEIKPPVHKKASPPSEGPMTSIVYDPANSNRGEDQGSKHHNRILLPDNSKVPIIQPVNMINSNRIIGPVSESLANSGNMEAVEKAILNGDTENSFSPDNWNQPIMRFTGKTKVVPIGQEDPERVEKLKKHQRGNRLSHRTDIKKREKSPLTEDQENANKTMNSATSKPVSSPKPRPTLPFNVDLSAVNKDLKSEPLFDVPNGALPPKRSSGALSGRSSFGGGGGDTFIPESDLYQVGPPWKDEKIVGKFPEFTDRIGSIQISFRAASKLCQSYEKNNSEASGGRSKRLFLWAPINQYIPLLHKGFPLREPIFAPECLKWVLRECRGNERRPMLQPCTFWAPERIRRQECGFTNDKKSMIVNYRMPYFSPGNCPCTWPCTKRFDPIQRCRVEITSVDQQVDLIDQDGEPAYEGNLEIQEHFVAQLCRGMKAVRSRDQIISIGWIPIRVEGIDEVSGKGSSRKKREILEESEDNSNSPNSSKKGIMPTKTPEQQKKQRLKPKHFLSPDDGAIVDVGDVGGKGRFKQIVSYNPDPHLLESNGTEGRSEFLKVKSCNVWRYKTCNKAGENRRMKRQVDTSPLVPEDEEEGKEIVSEESVIIDEKPKQNCGEWKKATSTFCVAEGVARKSTTPTVVAEPPSSEEVEGKSSQLGKSLKRKVVKNLCPGSEGHFPCFLVRKKRSTRISIDVVNSLSEEGEGEEYEEYEDEDETMEVTEEFPPKVVGKRQAANYKPGGESTDKSGTYYSNRIKMPQDPSCRCDWPCLPFFDKINRCYDEKGNILVDNKGKFVVPTRSFRKAQRDPVVCINFVETEEIFCKQKEKRR